MNRPARWVLLLVLAAVLTTIYVALVLASPPNRDAGPTFTPVTVAPPVEVSG